MVKRIRTSDPRGLNKARCSKFCVGSRVRQTPEEGRRIYRSKRCEYNNKDENNSPKTPNDKNHDLKNKFAVYKLLMILVKTIFGVKKQNTTFS